MRNTAKAWVLRVPASEGNVIGAPLTKDEILPWQNAPEEQKTRARKEAAVLRASSAGRAAQRRASRSAAREPLRARDEGDKGRHVEDENISHSAAQILVPR